MLSGWTGDDDVTCGGEWYGGVVLSLDHENRTVYIKSNDGDTDDTVP